MNMATNLVPSLSPSTADYTSVSRRTAADPAPSDMTSPHHVDFQVVETTDDVNVNEKKTKGRFLTAKYPKHQMGLIRRRLTVEDWIDEQLKMLFDIVSHFRRSLIQHIERKIQIRLYFCKYNIERGRVLE